jgi:hypothetical protein
LGEDFPSFYLFFIFLIFFLNFYIYLFIYFLRSETDLDQKSLESRDYLGSCGLAKMDQIYGVKMPHTGCDVCFWAGFNRLDIMSQKSG